MENLCLNCDIEFVNAAFSDQFGEGFCSAKCQREAHEDFDGEPSYIGMEDDADALASAGFGTDEDYGYCGGYDD